MQVDVVSYENITSDSPVWPALMGINAQLASISRSVSLVLGTLKSGAAQQQQQSVRAAREILPTPGTSPGGSLARLPQVRIISRLHDVRPAVVLSSACTTLHMSLKEIMPTPGTSLGGSLAKLPQVGRRTAAVPLQLWCRLFLAWILGAGFGFGLGSGCH